MFYANIVIAIVTGPRETAVFFANIVIAMLQAL